MAEYVKKKIVEKLARFTKDLKPDDISLNFLRGKGELRNLELNAELINEVLRLPPWIAVTSVNCDSIRVSVPFTDLHRSPIHAILGKVVINVTTCGSEEEDAGPKLGTHLKLKMGGNTSSYGLTEKIIDGMKIEIRSIIVHFSNPIFQGRLEMSDVLIQSTTPEWKPAALPHCRYKNEEEGFVIIYKKCTWSSLKVEGWEVAGGSTAAKRSSELAQLRLITDSTEIRVALKRCTSDCRIMHMRVSVHLGDVVWVLTQSQLKATSMLAQSLIEAALKWAQREREGMRGSQESIDSVGVASGGQPEEEREETVKKPHKGKKGSKEMAKEARLRHLEWDYQEGKRNLPAYEVIQDSFHIKTGNVDLQLCDDRGSLLLQLKELIVDIYPDQPATTGRCHWHKANSKLEENVQWSRELVKLSSKVQHMDLPSVSLFKLRERGIVVRCSHFQICPMDGAEKELPIIASDKETFKIPDEADNPAFQCGLTMYYYAAEYAHKFLVPRPNLYIFMSPIHISFHQQHCLWLVEFLHGVIRTVNLDLVLAVHNKTHTFLETIKSKRASIKQLPGIDIQLFVPYTKMTLPLMENYADGRPRALQLETGSIHLQNHALISLFDTSSFLDAWSDFSSSWLFTSSGQFPHSEGDPAPIPDNLRELINKEIRARRSHQSSSSSSPLPPTTAELERKRRREKSTADERTFSKLSMEQLKLSTLECWHASTECVSLSFADDLTHQATLYTTDFVRDFPINLWFFQPTKVAEILDSPSSSSPPSPIPSSSSSLPMLHLLVHAPKPLHVQLEHLHYLFLMRLKESFQDFKNSLQQLLSLDSIIDTQEQEAFHSHLLEGEGDEAEGDSTDGRDLRERISAAIAQIGRSDHQEEQEEEGEGKEREERNAADGNMKREGESFLTIGAALKGLEVVVKLPSIATGQEDRQTQTTPTPLNTLPQVYKPTCPALHLSPSPSASEHGVPLPSAALSHDHKAISLPQLSGGSGGRRQLCDDAGGKAISVTTLPLLSMASNTPESEDRESFLLVSGPSSSSSTEPQHAGVEEKKETGEETIASEIAKGQLHQEQMRSQSSEVPPSVDGGPPQCGSIPLEEATPSQEPSPLPQIKSLSVQRPPEDSLPILVVHAGGAKMLVFVSADNIHVRAAVKSVGLSELTEEELGKIGESVEEPATQECPMIKARLELGKSVAQHFSEQDLKPGKELDSVLFLKIAGLRSTLALPTVMAVKDFFDDEVEPDLPMPVQLRILETNLVLRDDFKSEPSCPHNLTLNIPDLFIIRGLRAHGTNLLQLSTPGGEQPSKYLSEDTEEVLLESFKAFIRAFQTHVAQAGEVNPHPERVSQLLHRLQDKLSSPPSYTEAISCDFYTNLTTHLPQPTLGSLQAELEHLSRENAQLKEDLCTITAKHATVQQESDDVTRQLVSAKVELASAHLVLEQQKKKIEQLSSDKMNLEEVMGLRQPSRL